MLEEKLGAFEEAIQEKFDGFFTNLKETTGAGIKQMRKELTAHGQQLKALKAEGKKAKEHVEAHVQKLNERINIDVGATAQEVRALKKVIGDLTKQAKHAATRQAAMEAHVKDLKEKIVAEKKRRSSIREWGRASELTSGPPSRVHFFQGDTEAYEAVPGEPEEEEGEEREEGEGEDEHEAFNARLMRAEQGEEAEAEEEQPRRRVSPRLASSRKSARKRARIQVVEE